MTKSGTGTWDPGTRGLRYAATWDSGRRGYGNVGLGDAWTWGRLDVGHGDVGRGRDKQTIQHLNFVLNLQCTGFGG